MSNVVASQPVRLPQRVVRLLDQQFWLWGCGVKHPAGNLLVRFGFRRIPAPNSVPSGSSVYVLEMDPCKSVVLRGSAAFYGDEDLGGMLIKRFDSLLYRTPAAQLEQLPHTPDCLPPLERFQETDQRSNRLASEMFCWIAQYEAWVLENFGIEYIHECLKLRGKRPIVTEAAPNSEWLEIAEQFA